MALTVEQLYSDVLGRAPDPEGLSFWQNYMGSTVDPNEIAAFVAAAQAEKPGVTYTASTPTPTPTPTLIVPDNYPIYGPSGPIQTPISKTPVPTPAPVPFNLTPVTTQNQLITTTTPTPTPSSSTAPVGLSQLFARPKYRETAFRTNAPTLEQLYQSVLGRPADERGLEFWRGYMGSTIDPDEIAAFVNAAQSERPGAFYSGVPSSVPIPSTYATNALLGNLISGAPSVVRAPSFKPYSGIPTNPATGKPMLDLGRPPANVSPEGFTAQDVAKELVAQEAMGRGMKAGGLASLAQRLEHKGRNGDTELVHMTKDEVAGLHALARSMGGHLTRNPHTGLYEANWISKAWRKVNRAAGNVADALGLEGVYKGITGGIKSIGHNPYVQMALTTLAGMTYGPAAAGALRTGFALDAGKKPGEALREGAKTAALSYGLQELTGAPPVGTQPPAPVTDAVFTPAPGPENIISYTPNASSIMGGAPPVDQFAAAPTGTVTDAVASAPSGPTGLTESEVIPRYTSSSPGSFNIFEAAPGVPGNQPFVGPESAGNLASSALEMGVEGAKAVGIDTLPKAALAATLGYSAIQGKREQEQFNKEQARLQADADEKRRRYREQAAGIMSRYPIRFAAGGGEMAVDDELGQDGFAAGGMPPRFLSGGGDGMSDSIPATIAGKQPARLADGEFVIPADVVSGLGNGSSKAGAKQLYAMMDRIRQARTGTTKQGKAINARRLMPV